MNTRTLDPKDALDYPTHLASRPDHFVIWTNGGPHWPDAARQLSYLSRNYHILQDWSLWSMFHEEAVTFLTREDAIDFLKSQTKKRREPYPVEVSTIRDMIEANFIVGKQRRFRNHGDEGGIWYVGEDAYGEYHETLPMLWLDKQIQIEIRHNVSGSQVRIHTKDENFDLPLEVHKSDFKIQLSQYLNRFIPGLELHKPLAPKQQSEESVIYRIKINP